MAPCIFWRIYGSLSISWWPHKRHLHLLLSTLFIQVIMSYTHLCKQNVHVMCINYAIQPPFLLKYYWVRIDERAKQSCWRLIYFVLGYLSCWTIQYILIEDSPIWQATSLVKIWLRVPIFVSNKIITDTLCLLTSVINILP